MKSKIQNALKEVRNTTVLVDKFIRFVKSQPKTEINNCFSEFKSLYQNKPFYEDIKDPILSEVEALGMDADNISELL